MLERELAEMLVEVLHLEMQAADLDPAAPLYGEQGLGLDSIDILEMAEDGRLGPEAPIETEEEIRLLRRRLERLDDRERTVLSHCFGLDGNEPENLSAIGRRLGVSREWVRQIVARALLKLESPGSESAAPAPTPARHRRRQPNAPAPARRDRPVAASRAVGRVTV